MTIDSDRSLFSLTRPHGSGGPCPSNKQRAPQGFGYDGCVVVLKMTTAKIRGSAVATTGYQ